MFVADRIDDLLNYIMEDMSDESAWNNFEDVLGKFDSDQYYDDNCLNTDAESWGEAAGVADDIEEMAASLVDLIREEFSQWIHAIDFGCALPCFELNIGAMYLSFNYTSTLESVYGIPSNNIKYLHGKAGGGCDLIFGHGKRVEYEPEQDENGDSNRHMYTDAENAARIVLASLYKNVEGIIQRDLNYFRSLSKVSKVIVIGHSLNNIDLLTFEK